MKYFLKNLIYIYMTQNFAKFNKNFNQINVEKLDESKLSEIFNIGEEMNSYDLKQFSIINKIPLTVTQNNGNNLIHEIINSDDNTKNEQKRLTLIKFLVNEGVNPDAPNSNNNTPLHFACEKQYEKIIKYLLKIGADPNYHDNIGMTPFHYLLSGKIDLCPPNRDVKDFIPKLKKTNDVKINNLLKIKKEIWDEIKDEDIIKSLKDSILNADLPPDANKFLIQFQKDLVKLATDDNTDDINQLKELIEPFKTQMREWINKQFGNFSKIEDLEIHEKNKNSWTNTKNENLATIKNHDSKNKIKKLIKETQNMINNLKLNLIKINEKDEDGNIIDSPQNISANFILNDAIRNNESEIREQIGGNGRYNVEEKNGKIELDIKNKTELFTTEFPNFKDDIINLDYMTFIASDSEVKINPNNDKFKENNNNSLLTYIHNINQNSKFPENLKKILLSIIKNEKIDIDKITNQGKSKGTDLEKIYHKLITNEKNYNNLINPIFLYSNIVRIDKEIDENLLLLLSAMINKKESIRQSLIFTHKVKFIDEIKNNLPETWFSFLLVENNELNNYDKLFDDVEKTDIDNDLFKEVTFDNHHRIVTNISKSNNFNKKIIGLISLLYVNFNKKTIDLNLDNELFNWIPKIKSNIPLSEKIVQAMVYYYDTELTDKPPLQYLADSIHIIRSNSLEPDALNNRIKDLYVSRTGNNYKLENDNYKYLNKFDENVERNYNISNISSPSELGAELSKIETQTAKNKYNVSKLLGLSYIGSLKENDNIFNENKVLEKKDVNNQDQDKIIISDNYNLNELKNFLNPTSNIINILHFLIKKINKVNKIISKILEKLKIELGNSNSTKKFINVLPVYYTLLGSYINIQELYNDLLESYFIENKDNYYVKLLTQKEYDIIIEKKSNLLNDFIDIVNKLNGYYYLYSYIKRERNLIKDNIKVPQFIYNLIPKLNEKKNYDLEYYDNEKEELQIGGSISYNTGINYENMINNIRNGRLYLNKVKKNGSYVQASSETIPPSVMPLFKEYYTINIIDLIKNKLSEKGKFDYIKDISINFKIENREIFNEHFYAIIVEELVSGYLKDIIDNYVQISYMKIISGYDKDFANSFNLTLKNETFEESINFKESNVSRRILNDLNKNNKKILLSFYHKSEEPEKIDKYYLYSNDYTNTNLFRSFYCLELNHNSIKRMLNNYARPYITDSEDNTALHYLLKNYYSKPIKLLKDREIDFGKLNNKTTSPINYLKNEYLNHIYKFINGLEKDLDFMINFTKNHYDEIKNIIYANENFGNNVIKNLKNSFNICVYLTDKLLKKNILVNNFNCDYDEIQNGLRMINQRDDYNLNELLDNNLNEYLRNNAANLFKDINIVLTSMNKKVGIKNFELATENLNLQNCARKLNTKLNNNNKNLINSNLTIDYNLNVKEIDKNNDIITINKGILDNESSNNTIILNKFPSNLNYIKDLNKLLNDSTVFDKNHGAYIYNFTKYLDSKNNNKNLFYQSSKLEFAILKSDLKRNDIKDSLKKIYTIYNISSNLAQKYYQSSKYLSNKVVSEINDIIIHLTQNIICHNLEMIIRKILVKYFLQIYPLSDNNDIVRKIDHVLKSKNKDFIENNNYTTILDVLYLEIAPKLVKNTINFYDNKDDKQTHNSESVREILENFFELFTITEPIKLNKSDPIMRIFLDEVTNYFDSFTGKLINNWLSIIENKFRYIINTERIQDCLIKIL